MSASYTKLKSGEWGVRSTEEVKAGQKITVVKKDGSKKEETIEKVLWTDNKIWLCSIKQRPVCAECGKPGDLVEDLEDGMMKHYKCCDIPP